MSPSDEPRRTTRTFLVAGVALLLLAGTGGMTQALGTPALPTALEKAEAADERGEWKEPFDSEIPAVNLALTPDGDVIYYSGTEANHSHEGDEDEPHVHGDDASYFTRYPNRSESRVYDPSTGDISEPGGDPVVDLFCSGTTVRPEGDVLTVGGTDWRIFGDDGQPIVDNPEVRGTDEVFTFSAENDDWTSQPDLNVRRWYPTVIETADGGALAAAGIKNLSEANTHNAYLEKLDPGEKEWDLIEPSIQVAEGVSVDHMGQSGNTELAVANLPMYPKLFVVPSGPYEGQILYPANGDLWAPFGERPEEAIWGTHQVIDPNSGNVTIAGASPFSARNLGNAVPLMLDPDDGYDLEILSLGGTLERTGAATPTAEIVDASEEKITSEPVEPMDNPRWNPNSVLLPTGDVLTVGGAAFDNVLVHGQDKAPILEAELFDAEERTWKTMASMSLPRDYHSTAVLLPSGEVLVGGHVPLIVPPRDIRENVPGQDQRAVDKFEVFTPPYLKQGSETRAEITGSNKEPADPGQEEAVASVDHGESFTVGVTGIEDKADVESAVLIKPGAVTHTVDADQRGVRLEITDTFRSGGEVKVTLQAPPNPNVAPPGHYMLFVNEDVGDGVYPSPAEFIALGDDSLLS